MPAALNLNPDKIFVIDFGQLGDVVLSLPALRAIRRRFPSAHISVLCGLPPSDLVRMSGSANDVIALDRVKLKYGNKLRSIYTIVKLAREVRRRHFDLVIDLHSLSETNLLAFISRAPYRLGARRRGRTLEFLLNIKPPREDVTKHQLDRFLDVLLPLGIRDADRSVVLPTLPEHNRTVDGILEKEGLGKGQLLVGLNPGGGFPGRRWHKDNFVLVGQRLAASYDAKIAVFAGPEERLLAREMSRQLKKGSKIVLDRLSVPQLVSAIARCAVFITNDTGPMHIATAVGTPVIALMNRPTPSLFDPVGEGNTVMRAPSVADIAVDDVFNAACEILGKSRVGMLGRQP